MHSAIMSAALLYLLSCVSAWYVDLSHDLNESMVGVPGRKFILNVHHAGPFKHVERMAENYIKTPEHMGSHMDSPYHFLKTGIRVDEIPFSRLLKPGVVINVADRAKSDPNAEVNVADLQQWEASNERISAGANVMMTSGWDQYWGDQLAFIGSYNDSSKCKSPGCSGAATRWLDENRPLISDRSGTEILALPMKIHDGTRAPTRMNAVLDKHLGVAASDTIHVSALVLIANAIVLTTFL